MSNATSIVLLAAESDVPAIEEAYGKPYRSDEGSLPYARRLAYPDGPISVDTTLAQIIADQVPLVGDIAPANQQPGYAFCAVDGEYLERPQIHGQPCALLHEDPKGRLTVDSEDLQLARAFCKRRRRAMDQIQERCYAVHRRTNHDHT